MLHAVIVGVDRYADPLIRDLSCARRDAEAVAALFNDRIMPEERSVHLLLDEQATRQRVMTVIGDDLPRAVEDGDVVVVYFACHGSPEKRSAPNQTSVYLILHDTEYGRIFSTAIDMEVDVVRWIERLWRAKLVLVLLDSCFSGGAGGRTFEGPLLHAERRKGHRGDPVISLKTVELGEGRIILSASDDDQVAHEEPEKGYGVFTHHLLRALQPPAGGEATISLGSLYEQVARAVRDATHGRQVPILNGRSRLAALPLFPTCP